MLQRGLEHLRAGELDLAGLCFERAHRLNPDCPEICYALGRERMRQGQAEIAEGFLRTAWEGDHSLISAAGTLARCLGLSLGRFDEAHAVLDEAAGIHGERAPLQVVRGELFVEQGLVEQARQCAEAALASADSSSLMHSAANAILARVYNSDGLAAADRDDRERALFLFKRAADLDPGWSSPHVNMGVIFVAMGKRERALRAYRQAVAIEPHCAVAQLDYGLLLRDLGDLDGACEALERAVECEPSAPAALAALAQTYLDAGATGDATELLERAVESDPSDTSLWTLLGVVLASAGDLGDAEACWRRAIDLEPDNREACARLADLLARQARFQEAAILAERAHNPRVRS